MLAAFLPLLFASSPAAATETFELASQQPPPFLRIGDDDSSPAAAGGDGNATVVGAHTTIGEGVARATACADIASRLGCQDASVRVLCDEQCVSVTENHASVRSSTGSSRAGYRPPQPQPRQQLPLLFMEESDLFDPWGHQTLTAPPVVDITTKVCNSTHPCDLGHPGLASTIQGGLLASNPRRPAAGYEIFFSSYHSGPFGAIRGATDGDASLGTQTGNDRTSVHVQGVYMTTTTNFQNYTTPIRVAVLNNWTSNFIYHRNVSGCIPKSMARSDAGDRYVIMVICSDAGLRPIVATTPPWAKPDSFSPVRLEPEFWDHDDNNLAYSDGKFVDLQIMFENQTTPGSTSGGLKYCDNVGLTRCTQGFRRIVTLRTSKDGHKWSNDAACPDQPWTPEYKRQAFDPQFHFCEAGWNVDGMLVPVGGASTINDPRETDPPELEFYKLTPMFVGVTKRVIGHLLTYAPAPQASLGNEYGMHPASCAAPHLHACHGPHIGIERIVGPRDGNLSTFPMMKAWRRPFRERVGNKNGVTPVGQDMVRGGSLFREHHIWIPEGIPYRLIGLPAYRLAGFYSLANSEFSTAVFTMPSKGGLYLNADAHWTVEYAHAGLNHTSGKPLHCDEGCAAYIMVALHSAQSGEVIKGFEKEACVFMDVDGTRLPLRWHGKSGSIEAAGTKVFLRIFYRDSSVFAVGAEDETRQ